MHAYMYRPVAIAPRATATTRQHWHSQAAGQTRVKPGDNPGDEKELGPRETSISRGIVARASYLSQDRSDIKFTTKDLSRRMAKPRLRDVNAAKRLARYLSTRTRIICHFKKQKMPKELEAWSEF